MKNYQKTGLILQLIISVLYILIMKQLIEVNIMLLICCLYILSTIGIGILIRDR